MKVGILKPWQSETLTRKHWSKSRKQLIRSRSKAKSFWNPTRLSASYRKPKSGLGRGCRRRRRSPSHATFRRQADRERRKRANALWKLWYCTRASGQHPGRRQFVHGDNLRAHLFPTTNCTARGITSNTIGSLPISSPSTVNHTPGSDLIETLAARRNTTASTSR
jgi:hypothetical protein